MTKIYIFENIYFRPIRVKKPTPNMYRYCMRLERASQIQGKILKILRYETYSRTTHSRIHDTATPNFVFTLFIITLLVDFHFLLLL